MSFDLGLVGSAKDYVAGELAAIVADDHPWLAALDHKPVEFTRDPDAAKRGVRHQHQASRVQSPTMVRMRKRRPSVS